MTTESLIINYGTNDRVGVYLFHHIIIVLYVCKVTMSLCQMVTFVGIKQFSYLCI